MKNTQLQPKRPARPKNHRDMWFKYDCRHVLFIIVDDVKQVVPENNKESTPNIWHHLMSTGNN